MGWPVIQSIVLALLLALNGVSAAWGSGIVGPATFVVGDTVAVAAIGSGISFSLRGIDGTLNETKTGTDNGPSCYVEFTGKDPGMYILTATGIDPLLVKIQRRDEYRSSASDFNRLERIIELKNSKQGVKK